ncbi:hypothetical protein ABZ614_07095 [Streptomyces sp. NPDC013178]|uniref:hypothetical protein n=1 Tax=Streptomyces sp. NPDC013178 TaxID=3155118 RepID=UPI0033DFD48E
MGVEAGFADPRLTEILEALSPAERAVTLALATPGVTTWAEAAVAAGAAQPKIQGERVRRKVKRLAAHHRPLSGGRGDRGEHPMSALDPVSARPARRREVVLRIALPSSALAPALSTGVR